MTEPTKNSRKHFRIEYPKADRPMLIFDKMNLEILDLSEKGAKFFCNGKFKPKLSLPVIGKVKFKDGKELDVTGTVLRYEQDKDHAVVLFNKGIPYPKMMEEQLKILKKYNKTPGA